MARTAGALGKSEREHKKDVALSLTKAQTAKVRAKNKALKDQNEALKK